MAADRLIHTAAPLFLAPLLYHLIEQTAEHAVKLRLTLLLFLPHHSVRQLFCFPLGQKIDNHLRHFVRFSRYCRIRLLLCRLCRFRRKRFDLRRCLHQLRHQLADRFQVKPLFLQVPDSQKNLNVLRSIAAVDFHAELVLPVPEHMRFLPGQLLRLRDQIRSIFHTAATPFFPLL